MVDNRLYRLSIWDLPAKPIHYLDTFVVAENGEEVSNDEFGVSRAMVSVKRNSGFADHVDTSCGPPILSEQAREVMSHFTILGRYEWLPVDLRKRDITIATYYALIHDMSHHEMLHKGKARYVASASGLTYLRIDHWAVSRSKIPEGDLFKGDTMEWFASGRLRDAWIETGLTGLAFLPVEIVAD